MDRFKQIETFAAVAAKGSQGSPNIIEVTAGPAVALKGDDEDPINGSKETSGGGASGGGEVSSSVTVSGPKKPKIMIAISGGTGSGYVSGTTEGNNPVKTCCFGGAIAVVSNHRSSDRWSAGRLGFLTRSGRIVT